MIDVGDRYQQGKRNFSHADLSNTNLTKAHLIKVDLTMANLREADLTRADLTMANLHKADLTRADLTGADLIRADLTGADLTGGNLSFADLAEADLTRADLTGADLTGANLSFANLVKANLTAAKIDYQLEDGLFEKISKHILNNPSVLDMNKWYCQHDDSSQTTRCLAGWAVHLAENGYKLQKKQDYEVAGLLLLGPEVHSHFFDSNEECLEWLKRKS